MSIPIEKLYGLIDYLDSKHPRNSDLKVSIFINYLQEIIDDEESHLENMAQQFKLREQQEAWNESREDYNQIKLFD